MHYVSSHLLGSGNTHFPVSLSPVMRMVYEVFKHLYLQCMAAGAAVLPFPFSFLFFDKIAISTEIVRLMRKKTQTVEEVNWIT